MVVANLEQAPKQSRTISRRDKHKKRTIQEGFRHLQFALCIVRKLPNEISFDKERPGTKKQTMPRPLLVSRPDRLRRSLLGPLLICPFRPSWVFRPSTFCRPSRTCLKAESAFFSVSSWAFRSSSFRSSAAACKL